MRRMTQTFPPACCRTAQNARQVPVQAAAPTAACPRALLSRVTATHVPVGPVPLPLHGLGTRRNGNLCPVMRGCQSHPFSFRCFSQKT